MGNFLFASIHGYLLYSTLTLIEKWQQGAETKSGTMMTSKRSAIAGLGDTIRIALHEVANQSFDLPDGTHICHHQ